MKNSELIKVIEALDFQVKEFKEVWVGSEGENVGYCPRQTGDILLRISPVQEEARAFKK